ncbi:MAG: hypothetical protein EON51_16040 [Acinetobacter sp.]|nr:MAG: hypothetical protein EON51_16040 [Acinetobacter sp.]
MNSYKNSRLSGGVVRLAFIGMMHDATKGSMHQQAGIRQSEVNAINIQDFSAKKWQKFTILISKLKVN